MVPTLIAFHKDDKCSGSPAMDAPEIKKALANSPAVEVVYFSGGKKPGPEPCHWKAVDGSRMLFQRVCPFHFYDICNK